MTQTATETIENGIKRSVLEAYTQTKCTDICVACELEDMFSGFNTAHIHLMNAIQNVRVIAKTQCTSDHKECTSDHKCCYAASASQKGERKRFDRQSSKI